MVTGNVLVVVARKVVVVSCWVLVVASKVVEVAAAIGSGSEELASAPPVRKSTNTAAAGIHAGEIGLGGATNAAR